MSTLTLSQADVVVRAQEFEASVPGLGYFRSCLSGERTREWLREEKERGRKIVGTLCRGVPVEIVMAAGGVPVRLSGARVNGGKSDGGLARDACPVCASAWAEARRLAGDGLLDAVVVPGTCDWRRKLAERLGETTKVVMLERPAADNPTFAEMELEKFSQEVGLLTDLPVVARNLKSASEKMARADEAYAALFRLRGHPGYPLSGADALAIEQAFMRDDISRWTERCTGLAEFLREKVLLGDYVASERAPRIVLIGSPVMWDEECLVHIIEQAGGKVVGEDFGCRLSLLYADGARGASSHMPSTVERWARNCFCSLMGEENEDLIFRAVEDSGAEGIIGHVYRGCARIQMGMPRILRRASETGLPWLAVETEGEANERERLVGRIEPFIEMLLERRRKEA